MPLPAELPGFTGRIARVTGANQLAVVGDDEITEGAKAGHFSIRAGSSTHFVRLEDPESYHYYVHVAAAPSESCTEIACKTFEGSADAEGPLRYRPARYVPVRSPSSTRSGPGRRSLLS